MSEVKKKKIRGNMEYDRHCCGERLTAKQALQAKCAECCSFYEDGKIDCKTIACPLYQYMPFSQVYKARKDNPDKLKELISGSAPEKVQESPVVKKTGFVPGMKKPASDLPKPKFKL